jgi:hypothetical protein
MANVKTRFALLVAVLATVVAVVGLGAGRASASSSSIVIPYQKTCVPDSDGAHAIRCDGSVNGVEIHMHVTPQPTGKAGQLTVTEDITVDNELGAFEFTAELTGHLSPAGFIVLNGIVTDGSFEGAQVHQRSNLADAATSLWKGELRLVPASA